jgi:uncharacterized repeat protein (TIGR03803 family)
VFDRISKLEFQGREYDFDESSRSFAVHPASRNGGSNGWGAVFELSPLSNGTWREKTLYNFRNSDTDGHYPGANLILDSAGNLYGTTQEGGLKNVGAVFELTPSSSGRLERNSSLLLCGTV